jgi:hypothetical protein
VVQEPFRLEILNEMVEMLLEREIATQAWLVVKAKCQ